VQSAIDLLRSLTTDTKASKEKVLADYHWLIGGDLVLLIAALIDRLWVL
jgi:hypothetical protein